MKYLLAKIFFCICFACCCCSFSFFIAVIGFFTTPFGYNSMF